LAPDKNAARQLSNKPSQHCAHTEPLAEHKFENWSGAEVEAVAAPSRSRLARMPKAKGSFGAFDAHQ
jgi:hypothetical protein